MHDMNDSWVISKNNILMTKAPLSWIISCAKEKENTMESFTDIINDTLKHATEHEHNHTPPTPDELCNASEEYNIPPRYSNNHGDKYIPPVLTSEEMLNTPEECDQVTVTSHNLIPLYSPLSSTLTMSPGKTDSPPYQVFCDLIPAKDISWIKIVRDYLTTIDESLDRKIKSMIDVYHTLRSESSICHSQCCSFERHGSDMGFMVHTLCTEISCANFSTCINNIEALESFVKDNVIVKEDPVIGQYEKGCSPVTPAST